jgi:hypothetical protein
MTRETLDTITDISQAAALVALGALAVGGLFAASVYTLFLFAQ